MLSKLCSSFSTQVHPIRKMLSSESPCFHSFLCKVSHSLRLGEVVSPLHLFERPHYNPLPTLQSHCLHSRVTAVAHRPTLTLLLRCYILTRNVQGTIAIKKHHARRPGLPTRQRAHLHHHLATIQTSQPRSLKISETLLT